jgi:dihydrofolate synthase/folylpolyglutamate synthase
MLKAAGYRVGQTPKPHLVEYRERIVVDGRWIGREELAAVLDQVLAAAERLPARLGPATEFELLTAAAFTWFARSEVDLAVIEVGLGGRLDATNVWDGGVAAITNVALDHADRLGSTIPAIAREKAAIIKRGDLAVTGATGDALAVVRRRARRMGAPLTVVTPLPVVRMNRDGVVLSHASLGDLPIPLLGRHQSINVAVALACLDALEAGGLAVVPAEARRSGLAAARWPGRLELIALPAGWPAGRRRPRVAGGGLVAGVPVPSEAGSGGPPSSGGSASGAPPPIDLLMDGAHNDDGMAAFLAALAELRPHLAPGRLVLIVGLMSDKDVRGIVGRLAADPLAGTARIIATRVADPRALRAAELAAVWRAANPGADITPAEPPEAALNVAIDEVSATGGTVAVAGSLYLVGAIRARLIEEGLLRDSDGGA